MNRSAPSRRRVLTVAVACALLAAASGCNKRPMPTHRAGGSTSDEAERGRQLAAALATEAGKASAAAQAKLPAFAKGGTGATIGKAGLDAVASVAAKMAPPPPRPDPRAKTGPLTRTPPRPNSPVVISDKVSSSIPYTSVAEADEDALRQAQDRVEQLLRELDPPVTIRPSLEMVRSEYVRRETRTVRQPGPQERELLISTGYSSERVYVEYDIQLTAEQIRELRTQDRIGDALRVMGVLSAVALAAFLFLRLDEWTKGYLTSRLAVAAILLGAAIAAAAVFI